MLYVAYFGLASAAFYVNRRDPRMLLLTLAVGVSVFIPVPRHTAFAFYGFCISAELVVGLTAWILSARGSTSIMCICVLLVINHIMGYALDGSQPLSPYRAVVKLLECGQLLACVACSTAVANTLRNRDEQTARPQRSST